MYRKGRRLDHAATLVFKLEPMKTQVRARSLYAWRFRHYIENRVTFRRSYYNRFVYREIREIQICSISTRHQLADILTKPLPKDTFKNIAIGHHPKMPTKNLQLRSQSTKHKRRESGMVVGRKWSRVCINMKQML